MLRFDTFTRAIYVRFGTTFDRSSLAVLSLVLVALAALVLAVESSQRRRGERYHRLGAGAARTPRIAPLGRRRWTALGFLGALAAVALALPLGVLLALAGPGDQPGREFQRTGRRCAALGRAPRALAGGVAVAAALPIAIVVVRRPGLAGGLGRPGFLRGLRAARRGGRVCDDFLLAAGCAGAVSDTGYSGLHLCGAVSAAGGGSAARGAGPRPAQPRRGLAQPGPRPGRDAAQRDPAADRPGSGERICAGVSDHNEGAARHPAARAHRLRHTRDAGLDGSERMSTSPAPPPPGCCSCSARRRRWRCCSGGQGCSVAEPAAISAEGLSKRFGGTTAARSVGFELRSGELLGVLGPSGCGKTTLLRLLAGFERPDEGLVRVAGRTVVGPGVWLPPERRRVGMVAQDFALFPHLTVGQNVAFGLSGRGASMPSIMSWAGVRRLRRALLPPRAKEMLELVGLAEFAQRYPHELSGGEAQRVALARALALGPGDGPARRAVLQPRSEPPRQPATPTPRHPPRRPHRRRLRHPRPRRSAQPLRPHRRNARRGNPGRSAAP